MVVGKPAGFTLLRACGGDQAPALQAGSLGSPLQPLWGMLDKMQSHSCLCGWSRQGYTALCKCCPLKGVAAWAVGATDGSRNLLRHMENAHPRGYAGKLPQQANSPLAEPQRGKSWGKAFLHVFVQTGGPCAAMDLGKRQSQGCCCMCWVSTALVPSWLWCLEAPPGHLTCPEKGTFGSSRRPALAPNFQHAH